MLPNISYDNIKNNFIIIAATLGTKPTPIKPGPFPTSRKYGNFGDNFKIICKISSDVTLKHSHELLPESNTTTTGLATTTGTTTSTIPVATGSTTTIMTTTTPISTTKSSAASTSMGLILVAALFMH